MQLLVLAAATLAFVGISAAVKTQPREEMLIRAIQSSSARVAVLDMKLETLSLALEAMSAFATDNIQGAFGNDPQGMLLRGLAGLSADVDDGKDALVAVMEGWRNATRDVNSKLTMAKAHAERIKFCAHDADDLRRLVDGLSARNDAAETSELDITEKVDLTLDNRAAENSVKCDVAGEHIDSAEAITDHQKCSATTVTLNVTDGFASEIVDIGTIFDNIDQNEDYVVVPYCAIAGLSSQISEVVTPHSYGGYSNPLDIEETGFSVDCIGLISDLTIDGEFYNSPINVTAVDRSRSERGFDKTMLVTVEVRGCTNPASGVTNYSVGGP